MYRLPAIVSRAGAARSLSTMATGQPLALASAWYASRHHRHSSIIVSDAWKLSRSDSNDHGRITALFSTAATVEVPPPPSSHHKHEPLPSALGSIVYTETDEAPALATYSLYPVIAKVRVCIDIVLNLRYVLLLLSCYSFSDLVAIII